MGRRQRLKPKDVPGWASGRIAHDPTDPGLRPAAEALRDWLAQVRLQMEDYKLDASAVAGREGNLRSVTRVLNGETWPHPLMQAHIARAVGVPIPWPVLPPESSPSRRPETCTDCKEQLRAAGYFSAVHDPTVLELLEVVLLVHAPAAARWTTCPYVTELASTHGRDFPPRNPGIYFGDAPISAPPLPWLCSCYDADPMSGRPVTASRSSSSADGGQRLADVAAAAGRVHAAGFAWTDEGCGYVTDLARLPQSFFIGSPPMVPYGADWPELPRHAGGWPEAAVSANGGPQKLPFQLPGWPDPRQIATSGGSHPAAVSVGAATALLAQRLQDALGTAGSLAALSRSLRVAQTTLRSLLNGQSWPDLVTVHELEATLPALATPLPAIAPPIAQPTCGECVKDLSYFGGTEMPYHVYGQVEEVHGQAHRWDGVNCSQVDRLMPVPNHAWVGHPPQVHWDFDFEFNWSEHPPTVTGSQRFVWDERSQAAWPW